MGNSSSSIESNGGGIYAETLYGEISISDSQIQGNSADYGGGVYFYYTYLNDNVNTHIAN